MRKALDYMRDALGKRLPMVFEKSARRIEANLRASSFLRAIFIGVTHNRPLSCAYQQVEREKNKIGAVFRPLPSSNTKHK